MAVKKGRADQQGNTGDVIPVEIDGQTVSVRAVSPILTTGVVIDTNKAIVTGGSTPRNLQGNKRVGRKRRGRIPKTIYPLKILAVRDLEEVFEFWLYGDREKPKLIFTLEKGEDEFDITIDSAIVDNTGEQQNDWEVFIKWFDLNLEIKNPPELTAISDLDTFVLGMGGFLCAFITEKATKVWNEDGTDATINGLEYRKGGLASVDPREIFNPISGIPLLQPAGVLNGSTV